MSKTWHYSFAYLLFLMVSLSFQAQAAEQAEVVKFTQGQWQNIISKLRAKPEILNTKNQQLIAAFIDAEMMPHIGLRRVAATVSGRHWQKATEAQKAQLETELKQFFLRTYINAISEINLDVEITWLPYRGNVQDRDQVVSFKIQTDKSKEPIMISLALYKSKDGWKIFDINLLGIWLIENYRNTFAPVLDAKGIEGLLTELSNKNYEFNQSKKLPKS